MKIHIVTDSAADLPQEFVDRYNVQVIPLNVQFGDKTYKDGIELSKDEFYEKMAASLELPMTSLPSPQAFVDAFNKVKDKGPILCIAISAATSGTYQSAILARDMIEHQYPIEIIDSLHISMGTGLQIMKAQRLIEEGLDLAEITEIILRERHNYHTFIAIKSLENVIKGGRISNWKGSIAEFFDIKPILNLYPDGSIKTVGNIRGRKKQLRRVLELFEETKKSLKEETFVILHAKAPEDEIDYLIKEIRARLNPKEIMLGELGPIMGSHGGFGAIGFAF